MCFGYSSAPKLSRFQIQLAARLRHSVLDNTEMTSGVCQDGVTDAQRVDEWVASFLGHLSTPIDTKIAH